MRYLPAPHTVTGYQEEDKELYPHIPLRTRFNLDGGRSQVLSRFYQLSQRHRDFYRDKSGMAKIVPYFVLPEKEKDRYPHPLDLTPLSTRTRWQLLRLSPTNLRVYQTFPSGKRVPSKDRAMRDSFFECRA